MSEPTVPQYIAFLRALNVGGHIVKMDHLASLFTQLGYDNVSTFIASGNVLFSAKSESDGALEEQIESLLKQELGYEVATFVRTSAEMTAIAGYQPFDDAERVAAAHCIHCGLLKSALDDAAAARLAAFKNEVNDFAVNGREFYWLCMVSTLDSGVSGRQLEKALGGPTSMRNMTTMRRLAQKLEPKAPASARRG